MLSTCIHTCNLKYYKQFVLQCVRGYIEKKQIIMIISNNFKCTQNILYYSFMQKVLKIKKNVFYYAAVSKQ